ncbi:MAG: hypothetical protein IKA60_02675 [Rikenellaceae bacterium]|nr:hypothetical protein [Rikenellaceae bacterium]
MKTLKTTLCSLALLVLSTQTYAQSHTSLDVVYTTVGLWNATDNRANMINIVDVALDQSLWSGATLEVNMLSVNNMRNLMGEIPTTPDGGVFGSVERVSIPLSLFKFGIEQVAGRTRNFIGVRNIHSDYFVTPWNSLYTAAVNGLLPTLSRQMPFANSAGAALGLHFEWDITRWGLSYKSSLYNGRASTRWDEVFRFRPRRDGVVCLSELAMEGAPDSYVGIYKIGAATGRVRADDDSDKSYGGSYWAQVEQPLYVEGEGNAVALILRGGYASKNLWQGYWGAGFAWRGVAGPSVDYLGALVTRTWHKVECETAVEVTYAYTWRWLTVQPSVHWVHTSSASRWFGELRASLAFNYTTQKKAPQ